MDCFNFKTKHNGAHLKGVRSDGFGSGLYHRPLNDFSEMASLK